MARCLGWVNVLVGRKPRSQGLVTVRTIAWEEGVEVLVESNVNAAEMDVDAEIGHMGNERLGDATESRVAGSMIESWAVSVGWIYSKWCRANVNFMVNVFRLQLVRTSEESGVWSDVMHMLCMFVLKSKITVNKSTTKNREAVQCEDKTPSDRVSISLPSIFFHYSCLSHLTPSKVI